MKNFKNVKNKTVLQEIYDFNLLQSNCYENLRSLCKDIGHRLSGSKSAQKASYQKQGIGNEETQQEMLILSMLTTL